MNEYLEKLKGIEWNKAFILRIISIAMVAALVIVIIVAMASTGGSAKPIEEVSADAVSLFENEYAEKASERMFKKYYGLNAADYDGVVLYLPKSNIDAQELLIVKCKDEVQSAELINAIESRLDSQKNIFESYEPEQYDLCCRAVVTERGNYILFAVHPDAESINAAFKKAL